MPARRCRAPRLVLLVALLLGVSATHGADAPPLAQGIERRSESLGGWVSALLTAPRHGWILVALRDTGRIAALDPTTLETVTTWSLASTPGEVVQPTAIALSADESRLYVAFWNLPRVTVLDLDDGTLRHVSTETPALRVEAQALVEVGGDRLALAEYGGKSPVILDLGSGGLQRLGGLDQFPGATPRLDFDALHRRLYLRQLPYSTIEVYTLDDSTPMGTLSGGTYGAGAFSPDGAWVLAGTRLYDGATLDSRDVLRVEGGSGLIGGVTFEADGAHALVQGSYHLARFDLRTGEETGRLRANCPTMYPANLTEGLDGDSMLFWGGGVCRVPKAFGAVPRPKKDELGGNVASVYVDGRRLFVSVTERNEVLVLRRDSLTVMRRLRVPGGPAGLQRSTDGTRLFVALAEGAGIATIDLRDLAVDVSRYDMPGNATGFRALQAGGQGRLLAQTTQRDAFALVDEAPGLPLRWLGSIANPTDIADFVADGARQRAYFLDVGTGIGVLDWSDVTQFNRARVAALADGSRIRRGPSPDLQLDATGTRLSTGAGQIINPITWQVSLDFARRLTATFDATGTVLLDFGADGQLRRFALPSGRQLPGSQTLRCPEPGALINLPGTGSALLQGTTVLCTALAKTPYRQVDYPPEVTLPDMREMFPITRGARWVYRRGAAQYSETNVHAGRRGDITLVTSRNSDGAEEKLVVSKFSVQDLGVGHSDALTDAEDEAAGVKVAFDPPITLLNLGDRIGSLQRRDGRVVATNRKGQTASVPYTLRRKVVGWRTVTVPAGTYRALRLDVHLDVNFAHIRRHIVFGNSYWLVQGLGTVKATSRDGTLLELVSSKGVDVDGDGYDFHRDNCPMLKSRVRTDLDHDGLGDPCDDDDDGDGVDDWRDNCPRKANANQADVDVDAMGDTCQ